MTHDDKRASVTGYECSMFHIHVSDVDVTRCEIHTTRRVSCHSDSWMKCIHSCEQHGAYMSLHSCHHQCTVSSSVSNCVCVCVTERLQLDFYCIFSHTNRQKGNFEILEEVHEDKIAKKMNCDFNKELMIFNKTLKQLCITHSLKNAFEDKCFRAFQPIFFWLAPNLYVPDEVTKSQK